ncbi:hypothetical protein HNQ60_000512 [Povalibacter uvarum]|uniref:Uncharacterized protein n=1 Tax=Povalibacter uvarum TaxID=732238 RepID=A0A841HFW8_9GAMM|nr:SGNH/GDSL hydrolase family protein [Povalibacter uvarum]MBB6091666.1 hypothetical protein [Povalibacter uvarum]
MSKQASWRSIGAVVLAAIAVIVAADYAFHYVTPRIWLRQVDDGVRDFAHSNPRILSISSSHGRSMDVVGKELARRTGESDVMVSVAMEAGKATHFQFVLDERLRPLIEERDATGRRVHDHLERALLVTEWWDSCSWEKGRPAVELPSHAWTLGHFVRDVEQQGITPINRNYLRWRWKRLLSDSVLVTDRGRGAILKDGMAELRGQPTGRTAEEEKAFTEWWLKYNEGGKRCLFSDDQAQAYAHIVDYLKSQGLDVTIVIFARRPGTLSEEAIQGTLAEYSARMREFADEHGVRLIDITTRSPLGNDDYMADYDHVNAQGNRKLAGWLLDGDLAFLAQHTTPTSTVGMTAR